MKAARRCRVEKARQRLCLAEMGQTAGRGKMAYYDLLAMPPELHKALDAAVMWLYGFGKDMAKRGLWARSVERGQSVISKWK